MCPDYRPEGITDIFVTHAHGDHLGSAIEISKKQVRQLLQYLNLLTIAQHKVLLQMELVWADG